MINGNQLFKITKIIDENNFDLDPDILLNRFCSLFEELTDEEVDMIIDLTRRYSHISFAEIGNLLKIAIQGLGENIEFQRMTKVIIAPIHILANINEAKETKSSHMIYYLMKGVVAKASNIFSNKKVEYTENVNKIFSANSNSSCILWVDDFIGSGQTVYDLITKSNIMNSIPLERRFMVTLVCHEIGYRKLETLLNQVCFAKIELRGISDHSNYSDAIKRKYIELMLSIETKIGVKPTYSFGVGKCEALISLTRTPNNTFPVYWLKRRKQRVEAPFER